MIARRSRVRKQRKNIPRALHVEPGLGEKSTALLLVPARTQGGLQVSRGLGGPASSKKELSDCSSVFSMSNQKGLSLSRGIREMADGEVGAYGLKLYVPAVWLQPPCTG